MHYSEILILQPEDNLRLLNLCGKCDEHLYLIEERLHVDIKQRGYTFSITGDPSAVKLARDTLTDLYEKTDKTNYLNTSQLHLYLKGAKKPMANSLRQKDVSETSMDIRTKRTTITARGENQVNYLKQVALHDINFGVGPAGTGKTFLAVASAVHALETGRVSRIILVRPIVEAGEKLGFLPGDVAQKVHPYLQPLYDALYEMVGFEQVGQLIETGIIELVPLAYMRGRSLNDSFIILDEAQNTTVEQMKMFLTRIGFNSKVVITGDVTQIDLQGHRESGLINALTILKNVKGISFTHFVTDDIVRHPLVQSIVEAYERFKLKG